VATEAANIGNVVCDNLSGVALIGMTMPPNLFYFGKVRRLVEILVDVEQIGQNPIDLDSRHTNTTPG
jgi:hypothetical protein